MTIVASHVAADFTGFLGVAALGVLRGLTLPCSAPLTILLDTELGRLRAGTLALRVLAGIARPTSGKARVFGIDPALDASLRRDIALLGDPVLLDPTLPLAEASAAVAAARGVTLPASIVNSIGSFDDDAGSRRKTIADELAAPERARLLLVNHPESYLDPRERDALLARVRAAISRGARVVVATGRLDEVLTLASTGDAQAALLARGVVAVSGPAHGLPWAVPLDGVATRLVRVVLAPDRSPGDEGRNVGVGAAARLAADLLTDASLAPQLAMVEPVSAVELRIHTRDPRAMSRAIAARAHAGLGIRMLTIHGAPGQTLAGAFAGGWR